MIGLHKLKDEQTVLLFCLQKHVEYVKEKVNKNVFC